MMMICKECGNAFEKLHAKGMCRKCYDKKHHSERREYYRQLYKDIRKKRLGQYVYIAVCEDGGLYIGSTLDLYQRMKNHEHGNSTIPSKPIGVIYQNYPNLTTLQRLQLERYLIQEIEPEHNTIMPTKEDIPYEIALLGDSVIERLAKHILFSKKDSVAL